MSANCYKCHCYYGFEKFKLVYLIWKKCRRTIYLIWITSPSPKKRCSLNNTDNALQKSFVFSKTYSLRTQATIHFTGCVWDAFRRNQVSCHTPSQADIALYVSSSFYFVLIIPISYEKKFSCINPTNTIQCNMNQISLWMCRYKKCKNQQKSVDSKPLRVKAIKVDMNIQFYYE